MSDYTGHSIPLDVLCSNACSLRDEMLDNCVTFGERFTAGLLTYNQALEKLVYSIAYVESIYNFLWHLDVIDDDEYEALMENCPNKFLNAFFKGKDKYK